MTPTTVCWLMMAEKLPKLQGKVHAKAGEMEQVERGVCTWTPFHEVLKYRGQPVLNGLFGVEKPSKLAPGKPVLRLIMNLVASNSVMQGLEGAVKNLPSITSWMSLVCDGDESVKIWQSDMCNAFYLFRLSKSWAGYLSFNILKQGHEIGLDPPDSQFALSCAVLGDPWGGIARWP